MRVWMLIALVACTVTSVALAQENPDADRESKIIAMEHVWAQAYMAKDPKALARILDDAFVCVDSNGRLHAKADVLADVKTSNLLQLLMEAMAVHLDEISAVTRNFPDNRSGSREAVCATGTFRGHVALQERTMGLNLIASDCCWRLTLRGPGVR